MNKAFVKIDIMTNLHNLKMKCKKYKDKNELADKCYKLISTLGKELGVYEKTKNKIKNIFNRIDWVQAFINAIVIYIVCHMLLKIF